MQNNAYMNELRKIYDVYKAYISHLNFSDDENLTLCHEKLNQMMHINLILDTPECFLMYITLIYVN